MKNKESEKKNKSKKSSLGNIAVLGASLAVVAAIDYFFFAPNKKNHRQQAKAWALKMKAEVIEKLEKTRELTEPSYRAIIDAVAAKYQKKIESSPEEVKKLAQDLKSHWQALAGHQATEGLESIKKAGPKTKRKSTQKKQVVIKPKKKATTNSKKTKTKNTRSTAKPKKGRSLNK